MSQNVRVLSLCLYGGMAVWDIGIWVNGSVGMGLDDNGCLLTVENSSTEAALFPTLPRHQASWQLELGLRQKPFTHTHTQREREREREVEVHVHVHAYIHVHVHAVLNCKQKSLKCDGKWDKLKVRGRPHTCQAENEREDGGRAC